MTAALRKIDSPRSRRSRQRVSAQNYPNKVTYLPHVSPQAFSSLPESAMSLQSKVAKQSKVANRANAWATPMWLRSLLGMNTTIAIATLVLVSAVMGAYSQVVYTNQHWGREYRKLERLQKEERQMTAFNEALKNDIAQTAKQEGTGLVTPDSNYMIVLEPAPVRPLPENSSTQGSTFQSKQPLGY